MSYSTDLNSKLPRTQRGEDTSDFLLDQAVIVHRSGNILKFVTPFSRENRIFCATPPLRICRFARSHTHCTRESMRSKDTGRGDGAAGGSMAGAAMLRQSEYPTEPTPRPRSPARPRLGDGDSVSPTQSAVRPALLRTR